MKQGLPGEIDPYAGWARSLLDRFFGEHMNGQQARLMVSRELLDEDYPHLGGSAGFIASVTRGPQFLAGPDFGAECFHNHALLLNRLWRRPVEKRPESCFTLPDDGPLFLPHLAMLCVGWTVEDETLPGHAFYERLEKVLPHHGIDSGELGQWRPLWDGLHEWTERLGGKRGYFVVEWFGHRVNVDIPRSQVILTPSKIARLPELFVFTGLAATWNEKTTTREHIRAVLLANEARARSVLGNLLYEEIRDGSEIGNAGIARLREFLRCPEYRELIVDPSGIGGSNHGSGSGGREGETGSTSRIPTLSLRLVLEKAGNPAGWRSCFGLLGDDPPAVPDGQPGWRFQRVDPAFGGLWLATNEHSGNHSINAVAWGRPLSDGWRILVEGLPGLGLETALAFPARTIRIFPQQWIGGRLVEGESLPATGGCYVLVTPKAREDFSKWLVAFEANGGKSTDYTRTGLPLMTSLVHLDNLAAVDDELRQKFPEQAVSRIQRQSTINLRGGSRIQSVGAQRVYLPYDPPDVVFTAPCPATLIVDGATATEEHTEANAVVGLPGTPARQFKLDLLPDATIVRITSASCEADWIPEVVDFAIGREAMLGANSAEEEDARFDRFGKRSGGAGILGPFIDVECDDTRENVSSDFQDASFELGKTCTKSDIDHPCWQLLEALSQVRRVNAREFRRRAERILGWWDRYAWSEARWTRALCHVEVERDNRGRLAYVYPVKAHAYFLPWKADGAWLAVIGGCPTRRALEALVADSPTIGVTVHVMERSSPLVPPRILLRSSDPQSIQLAVECCGIELCPSLSDNREPLAISEAIARWAGGLDEWIDGLNWLDGPAPQSESEFCPQLFRMSTDEEFHCPCRLVTLTDTLTQRHQWHVLSHRPILANPRHAFLLDPSWGKWTSIYRVSPGLPEHAGSSDEDLFPIPFDQATSSLLIPASLAFPTILSRALLTCSGLSPTVETRCEEYTREDSRYLPDEAPTYEGACHRYHHVPSLMAEIVSTKVKAWPFATSLERYCITAAKAQEY